MKTKDARMIAIVACCLISIYICYLALYAKYLSDAKQRWYEREYVNKEINGVLRSIEEFDKDQFEVVLSIKNQGEPSNIRYGVTCVNQEFIDFVVVGDSVLKERGSKTIKFCKTRSNCKEYELNFCSGLQ